MAGGKAMKKYVKAAIRTTLVGIFGVIWIMCLVIIIACAFCIGSNNDGSPGQYFTGESQLALLLVSYFPWLKSIVTLFVSFVTAIIFGWLTTTVKDEMS